MESYMQAIQPKEKFKKSTLPKTPMEATLPKQEQKANVKVVEPEIQKSKSEMNLVKSTQFQKMKEPKLVKTSSEIWRKPVKQHPILKVTILAKQKDDPKKHKGSLLKIRMPKKQEDKTWTCLVSCLFILGF